MKEFAIICMAIVLIGIQHLLNWMWRSVVKQDEEVLIVLGFFASIAALAITILGGYWLAHWIVIFL